MANNVQLTNLAANTKADALTALLDGGYLRIYDGTQPATGDTAIGAQVLLAELTFGTPAFGAAVAGVATANAITGDASANATGTATWFRLFKTDGTTAVLDGSVGISGCDLNLATVAIVATTAVPVSALTIREPKS